ncbi:MAG: hypothetical protein K2J16_00875, partial [Clostridia bacterium]|nr:hypothetical protein [Clostridia bacterium]
MRKRSLSVILLLILVIVMTAGLVACDRKTVDSPLPDLNPGKPDTPPSSNIGDVETMGAQSAWKMLKDAAFAKSVQDNDSRYISVDNSFVLGFDKDGFESVFVMRVAAAVDLLAEDGTDTSEILVELRQFLKSDLGDTAKDSAALSKLAVEGKGKLLTGMYYYESKLVVDLRGIKHAMNTEQEAVHVVYTENIDMAKLAAGLYSVMQRLDISDLIFNQLFGYNLGEIIHNLIPLDFDLTVENIITKLLLGDANATLVEKGGGLQTLKIPCDLSLVASLLPLLQPLISVDIINLVNKAVGLDLGKLGALAGMAIYIQADIENKALKSLTTDIDVNFNSLAAPDVYNKYGEFKSDIGFELGFDTVNFVGAPDIGVVDMLKERPYKETGDKSFYDYVEESAKEYSLLTFEGNITLNLDLNEMTVTVDDVLGSFGSLFTNIFANLDESMMSTLAALFSKNLEFKQQTNQIVINIRADFNTKNPEMTKLALEIRGEQNRVRLGAYYDGSREALYIDASGMFGDDNTKLKVTELNLNETIDGLFDSLFETIVGAIKGDKNAEEQYAQFASDGTIVKQHSAVTADDGNEIFDTMSLISAILDNVTIAMNGDIFNINKIAVSLTQDILDYIFGLVFAPGSALEGAVIPVSDVKLEYNNLGFAQKKSLGIGATLNVDDHGALASLKVGGDLTFGSISDRELFEGKFKEIEDGEYLAITKDGALNTDVLHVKLSTDVNINIEALRGELAALKLDIKDIELGDSLKGLLIDILFELESIESGLNADIQVDLDLSGGFALSSLLNSTAMISIKKVDGTELLGLYLQDGYLYINASLFNDKNNNSNNGLNIKQISVNVAELLEMFGLDLGAGSASEAGVAEDGDATVGTDNLLVLVAGIINGFTAAKNAISVTFATDLLNQLIGMLKIDGLTVDIGDASVDGGLNITLGDGLNLKNFRIGLSLGIGDNFDVGIGVTGLQAGMSDVSTRYLDKYCDYEAYEFTEILKNPYVSLDATLGVDVTVVEGKTEVIFGNKGTHWMTPTGEFESIDSVPANYNGLYYYFDEKDQRWYEANYSTSSISFSELGEFAYALQFGARLDLSPLVQYLLGGTNVNTKDDSSELMLRFTGKKFGGDVTTLVGIYYTSKTLHIDASNFGFNKIEVRFDLFEFLLRLLAQNTNISINGNNMSSAEAGVAADNDVMDVSAKRALALSIIATLTSSDFTVEVAKGLTDMLFELTGIDLADITAWVDVAWANLESRDNKAFTINANIGDKDNQNLIGAQIYAKDIALNVGGTSLGYLTVNHNDKDMPLAEYLALNENGGYTEVSIFNENGDIVLPTIFAEAKGTISIGANAGSYSWTVGEWLSEFISDDSSSIGSFLHDMLVDYSVPVPAGANIGFRLALNLRLNQNVPIDLTQNVRFVPISFEDAAKKVCAEVYTLNGTKYTQVDVEKLEDYAGQQLYVKEYAEDGIALMKVSGLTEGTAYVLRNGYYVKVVINNDPEDTANNTVGYLTEEELYVPVQLIDFGYILSHSDIAIELYNVAIEEADKMNADERKEATILAARLVYSDNAFGNAASTLYIDMKDDFHVSIANLDLSNIGGGKDEEEATTSAEQSGGLISQVVGTLSNFVGEINADSNGLSVNFAEALVTMLVNMLAGKNISPDSFVKLNPNESYLSFAWKYALALQLQIDPVKLGVNISSIRFGIGSDDSVLPADFNRGIYTGTENLDNISISGELSLDIGIKKQDEELRLEHYIDLFVKNLGISMGIDIQDNISYQLKLTLGANLTLGNPNDVKIVIELANALENKNIMAIYLNGPTVYIDLGSFAEEAFYIEDTNIAQQLCQVISDLLGKTASAGTSGDAMVASDAPVAPLSAEEQMSIMLDISNGKLGALVTQNVIVGLIATLLGGNSIYTAIDTKDEKAKFYVERYAQVGDSFEASADGAFVKTYLKEKVTATEVESVSGTEQLYIQLADENFVRVSNTSYPEGAKLYTLDFGYDIDTIIEGFDLGLEVKVDLQISPSVELAINIDSSLLALSLKLGDLDIETGIGGDAYNLISTKLENAISRKDLYKAGAGTQPETLYVLVENADGELEFVVYDEEDANHAGKDLYKEHFTKRDDTRIIEVDLNLLLDYSTGATYTYIDSERTLASYKASDRYSYQKSDGKFVQDDKGHYIRDGFNMNTVIDLLFGMDSIQNALANFMLPIIHISTKDYNVKFDAESEKVSLADILAHLGLNLMLDDAMNDGIMVNLKLRLDTEALGLGDLSNIDIKNLNFDLLTIIKSLEASICIDFTYEEGAASESKIILYMVDGKVYLDASGVHGPKIQMDLFSLLESFGLMSATAKGEAAAAADEEKDNSFVQILNMIVKGIVLSATPWQGNSTLNKIDALGVFFKSNMANDLLSLLLKTKFDNDYAVLDDENSGLFLRPSMNINGYDMLTLELKTSLANVSDPSDITGNKNFDIDVLLGLDARFDLVSTLDYEGLLSEYEKWDFISLEDYISNILDIVGYQSYTAVATSNVKVGTLYYVFEESADGEYVKMGNFYRHIQEGEKIGENTVRYSRKYVMYEGDVVNELTYEEQANGDYAYDEENDIFVLAKNFIGDKSKLYKQSKTPIVDENEEPLALSALRLFSKQNAPEYTDQNIYLGVSGLVYFNSSSVETYNVGGLVSDLFGKMIIELQAQSVFNGGVGINIGANVDIAKLDLKALASGKTSIGDFIANSDLNDIELAIEFVEVNAEGRFARYGNGSLKVLGGLYLSGGSLYIDAAEIISSVENYSRIDNFFEVAKETIDKISGIIGGGDKKPNEDAQVSADDSVQNDKATAERNALIALAYTDTALQLQLTRSLLAFVLATILPDLGSLEDIFDTMQITLGIDHSYVDYKKISDITNPDEKEKWETGLYKPVELEKYYVVNNGSKSSYYKADETAIFDATNDPIQNFVEGGTYLNDGTGYVLVEREAMAKSVTVGNYYYVLLENGKSVSLDECDLYEYNGATYTKSSIFTHETYGANVEDFRYAFVDGEYKLATALQNRLGGLYDEDRYGYYAEESYDEVALESYYVAVIGGAYAYYTSDTPIYERVGDTLVYNLVKTYVEGKTYLHEGSAYVPIERVTTAKEITSGSNYYVMLDNQIAVSLRAYELYALNGSTYTRSNIFTYDTFGDGQNDFRYVYYNGEYHVATSLITRLYGYVKNPPASYEGEFYYRTLTNYKALDDFMLGVDITTGCLSMGLSLGRLSLGFGSGIELLPDYIADGKVHSFSVGNVTTPYTRDLPDDVKATVADMPTNPFYDTTITVGFSVELDFGITEGTLDFGRIFSNILGDLTGLVIDIPSTTKGYSSAHFRLDVRLMLDMQNITNSELAIELVTVTEAGYDLKWLGLYYINSSVYMDFSDAFDIPKMRLTDFHFGDYLGGLFNTDMNNLFVAGADTAASSGDALAAADSVTSAKGDVDFTNNDLALAFLFNKDLLTIALGDKLFKTVLDYIPKDLLGFDIHTLFYDEINGSLQIKLDTSDTVDLELKVALGLAGGRYEKAAVFENKADEAMSNELKTVIAQIQDSDDNKFYVFRPQGGLDLNAKPSTQKGYYIMGSDGTYMRVVKPTDSTINSTGEELNLHVKYRVLYEEGQLTLREVVDNLSNDGTEKLGEYFAIRENDVIYSYKAGALANNSFVGDGGKYDMNLQLVLAIRDLNVSFTNSRSYTLSGPEMAEYTDWADLDRIKISEVIDLTTDFKSGDENNIDLSAVITALLPTIAGEDLVKIISSSDNGGDVERTIRLVIEGDVQIVALINYARQKLADKFGDGNISYEELTLMDNINLLIKLIQNIGDIDLGSILSDIISFFNLQIKLQTKGGNDADFKDLIGLYMLSGTFELLTDENLDSASESYVHPDDRFDHYFETKYGTYYRTNDGKYHTITDPAFDGVKYSYDASYCHPNQYGAFKRVHGGVTLDLSAFNLPVIYGDSDTMTEVLNTVMGMFGGSSSDAMAAVDGAGSAEEDKNIFPLVPDNILGYIKAFVYGFSITSRYAALLIQPDYINAILSLIMGEDAIQFNPDLFVNKSNLTIYTDATRQSYVTLDELLDRVQNASASEKAEVLAKVQKTVSATTVRYNVTKYSDTTKGGYYVTDSGAFELVTELSATEKASYDKKVEAGTAFYYDVETASSYVRLIDAVTGNLSKTFVEFSSANKEHIKNSEKHSGAKALGINTPKIYTVVTALPAGTPTVVDDETVLIDGFYYIEKTKVNGVVKEWFTDATEDLCIVERLDTRNSFITAQLFLWNYEIGLKLNAPVFEAVEFDYVYGYEAAANGITSIPDSVRYHDIEEFIYSSEDKESDGMDAWMEDYYVSGAFSAASYLSNPRFYEHQNEYFAIDLDSLYVLDADGKYVKAATSASDFPEYLADIDSKTKDYYLYSGNSYVKIQRTYMYRKIVYRTDKKQLIAKDEIGKYDDTQYQIRVPRASDFVAPDKEYVALNEMFYLSLDLRGSLVINAGKIFLDYNLFNESLFKEIYGRDAGASDLYGIAYKMYQGNYVRMSNAEVDKAVADGTLSSVQVWVNSEFGGDVKEDISNVLGGIFGSLDAVLQVQEGDVFRLYFSLRLNISFMLQVVPFKLHVYDLDVAIDLWKQNADKLVNGGYVTSATGADEERTDGSMTHLLGLYYDRDILTGEAGLYLDLTWLLGNDAKIFIDLSAYSVEDVLNGMIGESNTSKDAMVAADSSIKDKYEGGQSSTDASLFINIFTNAIALNITSGFLKAVLNEISPDSTIGNILPNVKAYVKLSASPYSLAIGALLFTDEVSNNVPVLNVELALEGTNGTNTSSSLLLGREEDVKKKQTGEKSIFYYANFNLDENGNFARNFNSFDFVELTKDENGKDTYVDEDGNTVLYNGPSQRYTQSPEVMKEILPTSRYAFGSKFDEQYSHDERFEGILYTLVNGEYVPINEVETRLVSAKYRDIWNTDTFKNFTGLMYVVDAESRYVPMYRQQLAGFTGVGNLQYRLATADDTANVITVDGVGYVAIDTNGNGYTDMDEADAFHDVTVYTMKRDFTQYVSALDIDLNQLLNGSGTTNIIDLLGGLQTLELGASLDITLTARDIINWTSQMTEFIGDENITEYLYFLIASLENQAGFNGEISFRGGLK